MAMIRGLHEHFAWPTTFGGYVSFQAPQDYFLWEHLLNDTAELKAILEFGTAYGGFALYLKIQSDLRGIEFHTFDHQDCDLVPFEEMWDHPVKRMGVAPQIRPHMKIIDLLDHPQLEVLELIVDRRIALFCDNGNKIREVELYAPAMFPGSLLIVHDWGTEIGPENIPSYFSPLYEDLCDEIGSLSRVFRKESMQ